MARFYEFDKRRNIFTKLSKSYLRGPLCTPERGKVPCGQHLGMDKSSSVESAALVRRSRKGKPAKISAPAYSFLWQRKNRLFSCLVISPAGRPVKEFRSVEEVLTVLCDAIKAHRSLLPTAKISENNIIITDPKTANGFTGMLIDLRSRHSRRRTNWCATSDRDNGVHGHRCAAWSGVYLPAWPRIVLLRSFVDLRSSCMGARVSLQPQGSTYRQCSEGVVRKQLQIRSGAPCMLTGSRTFWKSFRLHLNGAKTTGLR